MARALAPTIPSSMIVSRAASTIRALVSWLVSRVRAPVLGPLLGTSAERRGSDTEHPGTGVAPAGAVRAVVPHQPAQPAPVGRDGSEEPLGQGGEAPAAQPIAPPPGL